MATKGFRRDDILQDLSKSFDLALDQLVQIWEEIGIVQEQKGDRIRVVMDHVQGLLSAMVEEEERLRNKLMKNVERFGEELLHLTKELHLPPHEPPSKLTILQLEKNLRTTVDKLNLEKHDRIKRLKRLREEDQHLCDILVTTPYYVPSGAVPSDEQLKELAEHVQKLENEKSNRHKVFRTTKAAILQLLDELERLPNTSLEREIIEEEEDSFQLSTDNMTALKRFHEELEVSQKENFALAASLREQLSSLWERLQVPSEEREAFSSQNTGFRPKTIARLREEIARCEALKLENLSSVIEATRRELTEWWDKCYYSEDQRKVFKPFRDQDHTEDLLEVHEREVRKVKDCYAANSDMLDKVARRQKLWLDFLEFERKAADPMRFGNRGCNLLKEEKARKKLMKELPRVEADVKDQIELWEKQHGRPFLVGGARFVDFVKQQWEDYKVSKESEKNQRHQKKAKEMEEEMIYGSKPVTPGKRRFIGTPAKTPNKLRKMNETGAKTPMSASRMHRSNFNSVYSPAVVPRGSGPKTPHRPLTGSSCAPPRKALIEKAAPGDNTLFSHTTVAAGNATTSTPSAAAPGDEDVSASSSLASVGPYLDFAKGLNQNARPNCRSSVMPKPSGSFI